MKTGIDRRVAHVIALMEKYRAAPLGLDELAAAVNLSPSHLTRLFVAETGLPPARFDRIRRLDHAYELLTSTFCSVKQVMAETGWSDASHFSRDFKTRFGVSPRALRARVRGRAAREPPSTRIGSRKVDRAQITAHQNQRRADYREEHRT